MANEVPFTINLKNSLLVDSLPDQRAYQGSDYRLLVQFMRLNSKEDATDKDFSFSVRNSSGANVFTSTGVWTDQETGEGYVDITAAQLNFSGDTYTGVWTYDDSDCADFYISIMAKGAPAPDPGTVIDWSDYTGYQNTATDGPVLPDGVTTEVAETTAKGQIKIGVIDGLYDLSGSAASVASDLADHENETTGAHAATAISNTPAGNIAATTVQAAIDELDTEKVGTGDSRLSDARTPTAHASTHATGGSDPVTAADVDPTGTAIAGALLAKANDNAVVKLDPSAPQTITDDLLLQGENIIVLRLNATDEGRSIFQAGVGNSANLETAKIFTFAVKNKADILAGTPGTQVPVIVFGRVDEGDPTFVTLAPFGSSFGDSTAFSDGIVGFLDGTGRLKVLSTAVLEAMKAKAEAGLALQDNTGTEQALIDSDGLTLTQLTPSLPLSLDANKRAVTLSKADFRTLIDLVIGTDVLAPNGNGSALTALTAANLTGQVAIANGGTGAATAQGAIVELAPNRVATLAGTDTLTTSSAAIQYLDPDGADRTVVLPATGRFTIRNTAAAGTAYDLNVVESDGTTAVDSVGPSVALVFDSTATDTWQVL